ncbi:hypothetical protein H6P81_003657 [Aristolochia fimbriata]|uniref:Uncharacterized protein n=1 Tax=Aristolochia fimbriata TaxID=158543 RepID=A0AAV7FDR4_ARIFI|nr:hypothetical protein H6P81_003657 [Aristolochia fimbriata]
MKLWYRRAANLNVTSQANRRRRLDNSCDQQSRALEPTSAQCAPPFPYRNVTVPKTDTSALPSRSRSSPLTRSSVFIHFVRIVMYPCEMQSMQMHPAALSGCPPPESIAPHDSRLKPLECLIRVFSFLLSNLFCPSSWPRVLAGLIGERREEKEAGGCAGYKVDGGGGGGGRGTYKISHGFPLTPSLSLFSPPPAFR